MGNSSKKKEKKKLKRLALQGNAPQTPVVSSNIGQMLSSLQNLQTVKKVDEVHTSAPVSEPMQQPAQSSRDMPNVEEGDWEDDEEGNDGGSVSAIPAIEISLPVAPTPAIEIKPAVIVQPTSETEYAIAAAVANATSPSVETSETENRNTVNQPEVNQESNMNVVNHPGLVAQAQPAPVTSVDSGIVAESAMEQMQNDAITTPPAATVTPAPEIPATEKKKPQAAFHNIQITKMFTLDLTNFDFMTGLKNSLSRVALGGEELNLYSPFRKGGKKTEAKPAAEGVLRYVLPQMLDLSDAVNNSRVMVVGKEDEVHSHIQNAIEITKGNLLNLFPVPGKHIVASYIDEEEDATIQLQFSDIVNVRSWTNSSAANTDEENIPFEIHNAVINTTVNAGMLYDAEDRVKEIHRIIKSMELIVSKRESASTTIVLSVALDASMLADAAMREMLDTLLTEENFSLYSRQELLRLEDNDFLPQSRESVENDLLVPKADIVLMRIVTQEEDEEEEDAAGDAEPAEAAAEE